MSRIFISYSREHEVFARRLATSLSNAGADIWIDVKDIPAGMKWSSAIQQGLDISQVMLVIVTPESMASRNVEDEWQYYLDEKKPVIPIMLQPAQIHFQLRRIQYIDFHLQDYISAFAQLLSEFERLGIPLNTTSEQTLTTISPLPIPSFLPEPFEWCWVTDGKVILDDASSGHLVNGTKGGLFEVEGFSIAKHPITNAQFQMFVEEGYLDKQWWSFSAEAMQWHEKKPLPKEVRFRGDFLPRVNVNWYEAIAFCRWLTAKYHAAENDKLAKLGGEWTITLPTEQQWQRAAQGDDDRIYPWGREFNRDCCNVRDSGIGRPTVVNKYPNGASSFGVMDMTGNVSEWCLTLWARDDNSLHGNRHRVLRGGSWYDHPQHAQVNYRDNGLPDGRSDILGFRVVCVRKS